MYILQPSARRAGRSAKDKAGYLTLSAADEEATEEGPEEGKLGLTRERGHARSSSLDLNKMISGSSVHSDMPAAEPPRPPPVSLLVWCAFSFCFSPSL